MNKNVQIDAFALVDDVMRLHPATIRVFLDRRMGCVGCPIGIFHTVEDACHEHGVELGGFLEMLRSAARNDASPTCPLPA